MGFIVHRGFRVDLDIGITLIGKFFRQGIDISSNGRIAIDIPPFYFQSLEEDLFGGEEIAFEIDIPEMLLRAFLYINLDPNLFRIGEIDLGLGNFHFKITMIHIVGAQELQIIF